MAKINDFTVQLRAISAATLATEYSGGRLPPIPVEGCHPFRLKAATHSGEGCHPFKVHI